MSCAARPTRCPAGKAGRQAASRWSTATRPWVSARRASSRAAVAVASPLRMRCVRPRCCWVATTRGVSNSETVAPCCSFTARLRSCLSVSIDMNISVHKGRVMQAPIMASLAFMGRLCMSRSPGRSTRLQTLRWARPGAWSCGRVRLDMTGSQCWLGRSEEGLEDAAPGWRAVVAGTAADWWPCSQRGAALARMAWCGRRCSRWPPWAATGPHRAAAGPGWPRPCARLRAACQTPRWWLRPVRRWWRRPGACPAGRGRRRHPCRSRITPTALRPALCARS